METVYDIVTVALFAGLAVLFLQRSIGEAPPDDRMPPYLVAAIGLAVANQIGNHAIEIMSLTWHAIAIAVIILTSLFILYRLRPFGAWPRR